MSSIAAYILAVDSISERSENARRLQRALQNYDGLADREVVSCIFWRHQGQAAEFLAQHPEIVFTHEYLSRCKLGQVCATLSHVRLWQKLLASDHDGALIFEDDIYINDPRGFRQFLNQLPLAGEVEFLRVHLHKRFRGQILQVASRDMFVDDPSLWGFAAYYLSRSGAARLLKRFQRIDDNVDMIIPTMAKAQSLTCKAVNRVLVEHHPFDGPSSDLQGRHAVELGSEKLQKAASTIWTSPALIDDRVQYDQVSRMNDSVSQLRERGYAVLSGVFPASVVEDCRQRVLRHLTLFKKTRPSASALHLAAFHRFPALESLHGLLTGDPVVLRCLDQVLDGEVVQSIGLSDITVNRSQGWHRDLLRGTFRTFLKDEDVWGDHGGGVYKVLLYLQAGSSLNVVRGSHLLPISLESDVSSEPGDGAVVDSVPVVAGDVVVLDIRAAHRGAAEEVYASGQYDTDQRLLISTVLGAVRRPLTRAMEIGNFHRLMDWVARHP